VPDLWDRWTLEARVVRGAAALTDDVRAWHRADVADRALREGSAADAVETEAWVVTRAARIDTLAEIVARLVAEIPAWTRARTATEHASFLRSLLDRWLLAPEDRGAPTGACRAR